MKTGVSLGTLTQSIIELDGEVNFITDMMRWATSYLARNMNSTLNRNLSVEEVAQIFEEIANFLIVREIGTDKLLSSKEQLGIFVRKIIPDINKEISPFAKPSLEAIDRAFAHLNKK